MPYLLNEPIAGDDLSISQPKLKNNTNFSDSSFGVDHYPFSDTTPNNGYHKVIHTPDQVTDPTTSSSISAFYGKVASTNTGVMQFSRGVSNAVPSPVTMFHSPNTGIDLATNATTNILDFTGISFSLAVVWFQGNSASGCYYIRQIGSVFRIFKVSSTGQLIVEAAGNILRIKNTGVTQNNIFWDMQFLRVIS